MGDYFRYDNSTIISSFTETTNFMKTIKISILVFLAFAFSTATAQDKFLKSAEEARALSQKASNYFLDKEMTRFFKEIAQYWPLPAEEINSLEEKTDGYMKILRGRFGKMESVIKVNEETIKDFALRETYILKFENSAIRLMYTYYKNEKGWILNGFKWDDSFDDEFTPVK